MLVLLAASLLSLTKIFFLRVDYLTSQLAALNGCIIPLIVFCFDKIIVTILLPLSLCLSVPFFKTSSFCTVPCLARLSCNSADFCKCLESKEKKDWHGCTWRVRVIHIAIIFTILPGIVTNHTLVILPSHNEAVLQSYFAHPL